MDIIIKENTEIEGTVAIIIGKKCHIVSKEAFKDVDYMRNVISNFHNKQESVDVRSIQEKYKVR